MKWTAWTAAPHPWLRRILFGLAAFVVLGDWVRVFLGKSSDFNNHWAFGQRYVAQEYLYSKGAHIPYPPFWGMAAAPWSFLPQTVSRTLAYAMGILALVGILWILWRLASKHLPLERFPHFWATVLAVALASRFIERELLECGPNLVLLLLAWLGIYFWIRRRELVGGTCLGLAVALKCSPALFLAYFAWKRQWKMVAVTTTATCLFTLAPALWMGPTRYASHMEAWLGTVSRGISQPDPSMGVLGEEAVQNASLRPSLARFLMRYPPDHKSHLSHPGYVEFLDLAPATAGILIKLVLFALLAALAWAFRRPVEERGDLGILWECAAVSLAALLFSPITWEQHCVAVIPACTLIARTFVARGELAPWMMAALGLWIFFILGLNYDLVGRENARLLHSYHVITWGNLALLAIALACRAACARASSPAAARTARRGAPSGAEAMSGAF